MYDRRICEVPRPEDPDVIALAERYVGHPAAPSLWADGFVAHELPRLDFRAEGAYVRQHGTERNYQVTFEYVLRHDLLGLAQILDDDGAFGARGYRFDGRLWTRDLLDSISELNFLAEELPWSIGHPLSILDVGAGYGRFTHRCRVAFPRSRVICCDAVPLSTALCRFYLRYREVRGAYVVPLDELEDAVRGQSFDLAISMHAFNEMPTSAVAWWLGLLARLEVPYLFLIPNDIQGLRTFEPDGSRQAFDRLLTEAGYVLQVARDKYRHDAGVQLDGLYPGMYMLYARHPERAGAPSGQGVVQRRSAR